MSELNPLVTWELQPGSILLMDSEDKGEWVRKKSVDAREKVLVDALRKAVAKISWEDDDMPMFSDLLARIDAEGHK
jgi:hypothetical protein